MKRIFQCFTLLFLCFFTSIAQEGLKKHTVSSGETLFSIAKKYNITPYDLQKVNPNITNGITVDEVLLIPETKIKTPRLESTADSIKASVVSSSISYTVKPGDTKYSISKRFGLTITALESQNPEIIEDLHQGDVLEIFPAASYTSTAPSKSTITSRTSASSSPKKGPSHDGKRHVVVRGDTRARIANTYGITVDQLNHANSRVLSKMLIVGRPLWIPGNKQLAEGDNYSHLVKRGDTKFGLSLRFNTTIANLERHNPHIKTMLIVGQTISMASDKMSSGTTPTQASKEENQTVTPTPTPTEHQPKLEETPTVPSQKETVVAEEKTEVVETAPEVPEPVVTVEEKVKKTETTPTVKETIVTVDESVVANPQDKTDRTDVTTAPAEEHPKTEPAPEVSTTPEPGFLWYEIQPKDTLYGLAQSAGMSTADFLVLNPELKASVQAGTLIKMPEGAKPIQAPSESVKTPDAERDFSIPIDLTTSANTSQLKKLLFFLPFSEEDYQKEDANSDSFANISDDFKRAHLEFYKGAHIAIDSLRKMYLSLDVDVIEAKNNLQTSKLKPLLEGHEMQFYDAIILPFYDTVEEDVAVLTSGAEIPVITASSQVFESATNNLYTAVPSLNLQRKKVLDYMMSKDAHIIVLQDANRTESKTFISEYAPHIEFVNTKKNGAFSEDELIAKFKKDKLNFVVIDSDRTSVFLNGTTTLLSELSNYDLQLAVLESSLIPEEGHVSEKRYRILNMVFPSLIPVKSTASSKQFLSSYQKEYNLLPSVNTMLGFDITFDSLLRLIQLQSFENSAVNDITEYTQLKFDYKKNIYGGFSNEGIYILQYHSDDHIREAN